MNRRATSSYSSDACYSMTTVAQALDAARNAGLDKLDADLLLLLAHGVTSDALHAQRSWLLTHDTDTVGELVLDRYRQSVLRRQSGEPLAYIVGSKDFYGLALSVDPRVLVPRPDTETLVDWALEQLTHLPRDAGHLPLRLLDLGTGSGAIALALKKHCPTCEVDAVDASAQALGVAQTNAARLELRVRMLQGHWFDPVVGHYDCIVSNPPYVADSDPHLKALAHEPIQALASGSDGLRDIREIVAGAPRHLVTGGWLLLEHGFDQGLAVQTLLRAIGFQNLSRRHDLAGHWRCTGGRWPGQDP